MLIGQKGKDRETFSYPPALPTKQYGFTLVEILVITVLLLVIITALVSVLQIGDLSGTVSGTKVELQQEVRRAMDTMINDLRHTSRGKLSVKNATESRILYVELFENETFTDPLFVKCTGYVGSNPTWSSYQIGYTFDATNKTIIRTDNITNQTWEFNYISGWEFRRIDLNLLSINVSGEKTARGSIKPTVSLNARVRLRNE